MSVYGPSLCSYELVALCYFSGTDIFLISWCAVNGVARPLSQAVFCKRGMCLMSEN